ncbi:hypothetical protein RhiirC2_786634 [Rhizophagus irregularis]|uniref:Uncharacterized protein n=1 Tax=Rhizophagus irregularis TaxID=588596 RepID=A0A2N1MTY3_9GLOM|nr:hypothetical protein RhiirC2_786634 [Rhizophagus irregularis]
MVILRRMKRKEIVHPSYSSCLKGTYSPTVNHIKAPNYFPIPNNYIIKTTWDRASRSRTIQCSIYYAEEKPHYLICFGDNLQYQIITPDKKTAVSGVYLFRLQLKCIDKNHKGRPCELKLHEELSKTTQIKRAKENKEYHITFEDDDSIKKKQKLQSMAYVQDIENIPCNAYRHLAAVESTLPQEYAISQTCQEINACMGELVPINFIDLNSTIPDYHYTTVLFPETENYPTLKVAVNALIQELQELSNNRIIINNIFWKFELFFSSDWKFFATCLDFNAANSNYFCLWCEITKNQYENRQVDWMISKSINILNENLIAYPGHKLPPPFNMISLKNHNIIIKEMEKLKIRFEFWKIYERVALIKSLWNGFAELYDLLGEIKTDPQYFRLKAKVWYELFLKETVIDSEANNILE